MAKNNVFVITYDSRIFGVFTEKEKAQDAYDNFEDLFLQYAQEDLPDELSVSMVEVPLDTICIGQCQSQYEVDEILESLVKKGVIEPLVDENGEFIFVKSRE